MYKLIILLPNSADDTWNSWISEDVPTSVQTLPKMLEDFFIIIISSPSLKFTIFLYLSPTGHFDIADPSSM